MAGGYQAKVDTMKISDCMTRNVQLADPSQTLAEVAQIMIDLDLGILPVGENDRLIGIITDRDIAVRGIAQGLGPDAEVRDVMSDDVRYCYDDQSIEEVADRMGEIRVRRLPVLNREKRLVGIVSLGDIAQSADGRSTTALRGISQPGGSHSQSAS
jgi:CBS domain-containing protein